METRRSIANERALRAQDGRLGSSSVRIPALAILAAILLTVLSGSASFAQETRIGKFTGDAKRGKDLYRRYCVGCHGPEGNGLGENASYLEPRLHDFTRAVYKCRSTPSGSLPLDTDLFGTIERGVHASGMPSWYPLTRQERVDLLAYVKSFSPRFKEEKPAAPVPIPPETPKTAESISRGKQLYKWSAGSAMARRGGGTGHLRRRSSTARIIPSCPTTSPSVGSSSAVSPIMTSTAFS